MEMRIDVHCHRIGGSRSDTFRPIAEGGFYGLLNVDGVPKEKTGKQECQSDENDGNAPKVPAVAAGKGHGLPHAHVLVKWSSGKCGKDDRDWVGDDILAEFPVTFDKGHFE